MAQGTDTPQFTPEQLQQHPDALLLITLLGGLMVAIVVGFFVMAVYAIIRMSLGKPLLRVEPWMPRVWGLIDLIFVAIALVLAQWFLLGLWTRLTHIDLRALREEGELPLSMMAVGSLSYVIVMLLTIGWLVFRYGASLAHIGFRGKKFTSDIALGVGATLLALPPVYFVMWLVSTGLEQEYDHPLIEQMTQNGTVSAFLVGLFCAVIVAPITEEFLFRVLLQGWLQSIPFSWKHMWWFVGASQSERSNVDAAEAFALGERTPREADDTLPGEAAANPYSPPVPRAPVLPSIEPSAGAVIEPSLAASADEPARRTPPIWPVFVSGTLFGLAHLGYGLSFVPLIFLGIILGFLYRATHSIWPCFAVHFILNLISISSLGILTYVKEIVQ